MEPWIAITILAAFSQNLRSALQKNLKGVLSTWGATGARFIFAAPLAIALAAIVLLAQGAGRPGVTLSFTAYALVGGLAQIIATGLLIHLFSYQNFTAATVFTKTEPIQTAVFGIVILGDALSLHIGIAIFVSLIGVVLMSLPKDRLKGGGWFDKTALIGIASGAFFGLSAVAYRGASLSLEQGNVLLRASFTLAFVTVFQSLVILALLTLKERGQTTLLFKHWRAGALVGAAGMIGSLAWFAAFTLENAAHVRAVGQVEILFMLGASVFFFKERITLRDLLGVCLVTAGIVGLVLATGKR
ncbi:MAG: DMT family transporter [Pseudomonadota bacterium]